MPSKSAFTVSRPFPDANEHTSEALQQLVTRDVEKYRKLLEEKK